MTYLGRGYSFLNLFVLNVKVPCGRMEMATTNPVIIDQNGKVIRRSNHIIVSILVLVSLEIASHASILLFRSF